MEQPQPQLSFEPSRKGTIVLIGLSLVVLAVLLVWHLRLYTPLEPIKPKPWRKSISLSEYPFKCGDVLLFSGSGRCGEWVSIIQKVMTSSQFTHVGLVYSDPDDEGRLYCWEMHVDDNGEKLDQVRTRGTRLVNLIPHIKRYIDWGGKVCVRSWNRRVDVGLFTEFIHDHWNTTAYSYSCMMVYGYNRLFPWLPKSGFLHKKQGRYCSELIASTLEHLGILDFTNSEVERRTILPSDFTYAEDTLPLRPGWRLGSEWILTVPESAKEGDSVRAQTSSQ